MSMKLAYLRQPRKNRVIVLEDMNFFWDECELQEIVRMSKQGASIHEMADYFDRDPDEVLLAYIHLAREDKILEEVTE